METPPPLVFLLLLLLLFAPLVLVPEGWAAAR